MQFFKLFKKSYKKRIQQSGSEVARKTVLLTGASTGLGLEMARLLIQEDKYNVFLTARSSSMYRFGQQGICESSHIHLRILDVTDSKNREEVVDEINRHHGGVDVLINNAGFTFRSVVEHVRDTDRQMQMDTNFRGPMDLIRLCLPSMREKKQGQIINVSSVGGQMAMPTMGIYSATKHALEGATESLWYEVKPWNISVSLLQPGFINSKGFEKVRKTQLSSISSQQPCDAYHEHYTHMETMIQKIMLMTPSTSLSVAKKMLSTIEKSNPPLRIAATWDAICFSLFKRFTPHRLYHWILYKSLPHINTWGSVPEYCGFRPTLKLDFTENKSEDSIEVKTEQLDLTAQ